MLQSVRLAFTQKQLAEQKAFSDDLANGNIEFAFSGSLLEGQAYLQGLSEIVEAVNHS